MPFVSWTWQVLLFCGCLLLPESRFFWMPAGLQNACVVPHDVTWTRGSSPGRGVSCYGTHPKVGFQGPLTGTKPKVQLTTMFTVEILWMDLFDDKRLYRLESFFRWSNLKALEKPVTRKVDVASAFQGLVSVASETSSRWVGSWQPAKGGCGFLGYTTHVRLKHLQSNRGSFGQPPIRDIAEFFYSLVNLLLGRKLDKT